MDVSEIYDQDLINIAFEAAAEIGLENNVKEGILTMLGGPTFETPAELRMLKTCGVDAVGKNKGCFRGGIQISIILWYKEQNIVAILIFICFI